MRIIHFDTQTSDWLLCIQRTSSHSSEIWFGALNDMLDEPRARLQLLDEQGNELACEEVWPGQWQQPFAPHSAGFCRVTRFDNLQANTRYRVMFLRQLEPQLYGADAWQDVSSGEFSTLPDAIPGPDETPFTIALASCYYAHRDAGAAAAAYRALHSHGAPGYQPDITFLTGDQVYLDIGLDSIAFGECAIYRHISEEYATNWKGMGSIMRCGATWMLPDDHEFWNDFPFYDCESIPALLPLKIDRVRLARTAASMLGVQHIQRSRPVEILHIGTDLQICLADFRTQRSASGFTDEASLRQIIDWAEQLTCPGILVSSQPLISAPESLERNLTTYAVQYQRLIRALGSSGHDILSMTGDVHFGRICWVPFAHGKGRLIEMTASPLSNLTGLNGVATAVANHTPAHFPHNQPNPDSSNRVRYLRGRYCMPDLPQELFAYPCARTREHFMTASLQKDAAGHLQLEAQGWLVRETDCAGLPRPAFERGPFRVRLR